MTWATSVVRHLASKYDPSDHEGRPKSVFHKGVNLSVM